MAIDFPAVDEYINCGSGATLDDLTAAGMTVACWAYLDAYGATLTPFVCKYVSAGWIFYTLASDSNKVYFQQTWSGGGGIWSAAAAPGTAAWVHLGVTYNGSSINNDPVFYINGILSGTTETAAPLTARSSDAADSLWIGRYATYYVNGRMEDVRVFNRILSAQEVAILAAGYRGPLGGEVGWWAMDGAQAIAHFDAANLTVNVNYIPDMSGNANTGNPTGTPIGAASACPRMGGIID